MAANGSPEAALMKNTFREYFNNAIAVVFAHAPEIPQLAPNAVGEMQTWLIFFAICRY